MKIYIEESNNQSVISCVGDDRRSSITGNNLIAVRENDISPYFCGQTI